MDIVTFDGTGKDPVIRLNGHIDSANAPEAGKAIDDIIAREGCAAVVVDAKDLEYISSAGLRVILKLLKNKQLIRIVNCSTDVYEIFEMTGFTEMAEIERVYREISVEGCDIIGQGANGTVYRISPDTIVKVYHDEDALDDIRNDRESAKKAFVLGMPTAIPFDVVRVGDHYGAVYELLNAKAVKDLILENPDDIDDEVRIMVDLLKKIHAIKVEKGVFPSALEKAIGYVEFLKDYIPADTYEKLDKMIREVPDDDHLLHGDFHIKNVMLQNDEALMIDLDKLRIGNTLFEFGPIFNAYVGFSKADPANAHEFFGITSEQARHIWEQTVRCYFEGCSEEKIQDIMQKAMIYGYVRIIRRTIRRGETAQERGRKLVDACTEELIRLVNETDNLIM